MDDSAPLSLWLSVFCIELKDYRQGVLDPHRLASLTAGFEGRLAGCLKCRFIGTSADTAHDPGIFNLTLLIHDKLDIDPALFTCLFCRFRILDPFLMGREPTDQFRHLLNHGIVVAIFIRSGLHILCRIRPGELRLPWVLLNIGTRHQQYDGYGKSAEQTQAAFYRY